MLELLAKYKEKLALENAKRDSLIDRQRSLEEKIESKKVEGERTGFLFSLFFLFMLIY